MRGRQAFSQSTFALPSLSALRIVRRPFDHTCNLSIRPASRCRQGLETGNGHRPGRSADRSFEPIGLTPHVEKYPADQVFCRRRTRRTANRDGNHGTARDGTWIANRSPSYSPDMHLTRHAPHPGGWCRPGEPAREVSRRWLPLGSPSRHGVDMVRSHAPVPGQRRAHRGVRRTAQN